MGMRGIKWDAWTYSYSRMDTYEQCPFKYKLRYVDKLNPGGTTIALQFGTYIHDIEETIGKCIIEGEPVDYTAIRNAAILKLNQIERTFSADYRKHDKTGKDYLDKAYYYLEHTIYNLENFMKEHPTYKLLGVEIPFKIKFDDTYFFGGAIDRAFYDSATDRYIIQDIKTWAEPKNEDDLKTPLQFVTYIMAVKELYHCTEDQIECEYYLPLLNTTQSAGTSGFVKRGIAKLNKLFKLIEDKEFTPAPQTLCAWCDYSMTNPDAKVGFKHLCPYHSIATRDCKDYKLRRTSACEWLGLDSCEVVLKEYMEKLNINAERGETLGKSSCV